MVRYAVYAATCTRRCAMCDAFVFLCPAMWLVVGGLAASLTRSCGILEISGLSRSQVATEQCRTPKTAAAVSYRRCLLYSTTSRSALWCVDATRLRGGIKSNWRLTKDALLLPFAVTELRNHDWFLVQVSLQQF